MTNADTAIHPAGVFSLLCPTKGPPASCCEDSGDGLAFKGNELLPIHLDLERSSPLDPFFYSPIDHL